MAAAATAATSLQSVVHYWKHFDLPQLQRELDVVATDLANRQDESDTSRRKLVELSKDFKKTTAEDVRQLVAPLLKNFQLEIDQLSKRCKAAEAAFLNVYKKLIDIPDPLPTLDYCECLQQKIQRVQELEAENKQLRDTLNEYNEELKEVKSQDVTIKVLKDRLKELEGKLECAALLNQKTVNKDRERELEKLVQDRERYIQDTQMTVNKKLEEAELKVNSLQSALEISQSELFDIKSRLDEDSHAKSDEMEIIVTDMERANQRASIAEKEVDQLKEQLSAAHRSLQLADQIQKAPDMEQAISILTRSSLEMELAAKDKEICQLVNEVQQLQTAINQLKETSASQIAQLEEQLELKSNKICKLEARLSTQGDYEEMRKELEILKSVDLCGVGDGSAAGSEGNIGKPLEMLLAQKAKSLQTENTSLKVTNAELQAEVKNVSDQLERALGRTEEQAVLVDQLENDLLKINSLSIMYRGEGEGQVAPVDAIIYEVSGSYGGSKEAAMSSNAAESLLPIVSSQRERFRQRIQELEIQSSSHQRQFNTLKGEVEKLREDNVKLYEKIRFLQVYSGSKNTKEEETERRYSRHYESSLDPFASFSRRERQTRYWNLSPFERFTLGMGKMILSNKTARIFTFIYVLILHCLVFGVLYKLAYSESWIRDLSSNCAESYAQHMQREHGKTLDRSIMDHEHRHNN